MYSPEKAFNRELDIFIKDYPNSSASRVLREIAASYPHYTSFYRMFDDLSARLGIGMLTVPVEVQRGKDKFIPALSFQPGNLLGEKPGISHLVSDQCPMDLDQAYTKLAKETLYLLQRTNDIKGLINSQQ
jgi:hypothetical protein